jgi:hypothetical protein
MMPRSDVRGTFTVLLIGDLSFQEWNTWVEACKADKIPTFSTATHKCPSCGTEAPAQWHIYIREQDKSVLEGQ